MKFSHELRLDTASIFTMLDAYCSTCGCRTPGFGLAVLEDARDASGLPEHAGVTSSETKSSICKSNSFTSRIQQGISDSLAWQPNINGTQRRWRPLSGPT